MGSVDPNSILSFRSDHISPVWNVCTIAEAEAEGNHSSLFVLNLFMLVNIEVDKLHSGEDLSSEILQVK